MAQPQVSSLTQFKKGLITEASITNFPGDAAPDLLNMELDRDGSAKVRKGIELDSSGSLSTFTLNAGEATNELSWENVSGESGLQFALVQVGSLIYFYDKGITPLSSGLKGFSINMDSYSVGNEYAPEDYQISGDTIGEYFVVANPGIETLILSYDPDADTLTVTELAPKVRDFEFQGDTSEYFSNKSPKSSVSEARKYDTFNCGWPTDLSGDPVLDALSYYPRLTHPWYAGKTDNFGVTRWARVGGGTSLLGNGHYILDLYNKDRSQAVADDPQVEGVTVTLSTETESNRISCVAGYAGRMFASGIASSANGSKVFFTKVIKGLEDFNKFYSINDPTAEDLNDLLDNDGGVIEIPQASNIKSLFEYGNSLLVFAENGVWEINGVDGVFKATEYAVSRVKGADGLFYQSTLVDVEGQPFWWGPFGIYTVTQEQITGRAMGADISKETIQSFWDDIGASFRAKAKGTYDGLNKRIYWLYGNDANTDYKYNRILIFDAVLEAFYPWSITDEASSTDYLVGAIYTSGISTATETFDVWSNADTDDVLTRISLDDVVQNISSPTTAEAAFQFVIRDGATGKIGFGDFTSTTYKDWTNRDYTAYIDMPYLWDGNMTTRKKNVFVTSVFNRTEDGFSGTTPDYNATNESKCTLEAYWDGNENASSSKDVYKLKRNVLVDEGDLTAFNYPFSKVITRNRIRGRGRYLRLRYKNTAGYQFNLEGVEVVDLANQGF